MLGVTHLVGFGAGVPAPPSISYITSKVSSTDATEYTFTSVGSGTPQANYLIIGVTGSPNNRTVSTLTYNGVSATQIKSQISGDSVDTAEIWIVAPNTSSGSVVVTWSGAQNRCGIGVWAAYNISPTASATAGSTATPLSASLAIPANGIAVGVAFSQMAAPGCTWTNLTERYDEDLEGTANNQSGADTTVTGASTPTITADFTTELSHALALASWGA